MSLGGGAKVGENAVENAVGCLNRAQSGPCDLIHCRGNTPREEALSQGKRRSGGTGPG